MAPRRIRISRVWWTGAIVLAAFALAAVASWRSERASHQQQQHIREQAVVAQLTQRINGVLSHERELANLLSVLPGPIGPRWSVLTEPVLNDSATSGVGFIGIVNSAQVPTWELRHHATIVAATRPGVFRPAPARAEHWVIADFANQPGVAPGHLGLDMSADPLRYRLLRRAAQTNSAVASPPVHLLSSSTHNAGVLVFQPIRTASGRLRGWVSASYQPVTLAASAVQVDAGARIVIHDGTTSLTSGQLPGSAITDQLQVANRRWTVQAWVPAGTMSIIPWLVLLFGAIIAAAITAIVRLGAGRERYALALVDHHMALERDARAGIESALARLQENERRLSETQTLAGLGSWEVDAASGRMLWSADLCRILGQPEGFSPDVEQATALTHPDDRERMLSAFADRGAGSHTADYRIQRPDGGIVWVQTTRFTEIDADGVRQVRGATQDITGRKHTELELASSRQHFEAVTVAIAEGYGLTINGHIARVNPSLCEMTGFSEDELVGASTPFPFWPPEAIADTEKLRASVVASGGETFQLTLMRKDGSRFPAELTARPAHNPDGTVLGFVTTIRDISTRKAHELEDRAVRELAQLVAENARPSAVFDRVAAYLLELFGCFSGVVVRFDHDLHRGTFVTGLSHSDHLVRGAEIDLDGHSAPASVFHTGVSARSNGERSVGTDAQLDAFVGEISDAVAAPIMVHGRLWGCVGAAFSHGPAPADTEQRLERFADLAAMAIANAEAWDSLERQASTDSLTTLANHRTFQEQLRAEINRSARYGRALSLVLLDIDHFKAVNDTYGHQTGDSVLVEISRILRQHGRYGDLIARTGGEEFALLMPETDAGAALHATERLRQMVEEHDFDGVGSVTISAGISAALSDDSATEIFGRADQALYRAKHLGRNRTEVDGMRVSGPGGAAQAASSAAAR